MKVMKGFNLGECHFGTPLRRLGQPIGGGHWRLAGGRHSREAATQVPAGEEPCTGWGVGHTDACSPASPPGTPAHSCLLLSAPVLRSPSPYRVHPELMAFLPEPGLLPAPDSADHVPRTLSRASRNPEVTLASCLRQALLILSGKGLLSPSSSLHPHSLHSPQLKLPGLLLQEPDWPFFTHRNLHSVCLPL